MGVEGREAAVLPYEKLKSIHMNFLSQLQRWVGGEWREVTVLKAQTYPSEFSQPSQKTVVWMCNLLLHVQNFPASWDSCPSQGMFHQSAILSTLSQDEVNIHVLDKDHWDWRPKQI